MHIANNSFLGPQVQLVARFKGRLKEWLQIEQPELLRQVTVKGWWLKWVGDVQTVDSGQAALKHLANYRCAPLLREHQLEQGQRGRRDFLLPRERRDGATGGCCSTSCPSGFQDQPKPKPTPIYSTFSSKEILVAGLVLALGMGFSPGPTLIE